jgi:hypothetical protein
LARVTSRIALRWAVAALVALLILPAAVELVGVHRIHHVLDLAAAGPMSLDTSPAQPLPAGSLAKTCPLCLAAGYAGAAIPRPEATRLERGGERGAKLFAAEPRPLCPEVLLTSAPPRGPPSRA